MEFLIIHILLGSIKPFLFSSFNKIYFFFGLLFNNIAYNFISGETLLHSVECSYYSLSFPKSCSAWNFWFMGFSPHEGTNLNVFYEMSRCTKTVFSSFCEEDYVVHGFHLLSFSSLYIFAHGEHHRLWTALPLMDVTTFPQWLIFISFKR